MTGTMLGPLVKLCNYCSHQGRSDISLCLILMFKLVCVCWIWIVFFFVKYNIYTQIEAAKSLLSFQSLSVSNSCFVLGNFRCTRCKKTCYCSVACQTEDWKAHRHVCKPSTPEVARYVLCIYCLNIPMFHKNVEKCLFNQ